MPSLRVISSYYLMTSEGERGHIRAALDDDIRGRGRASDLPKRFPSPLGSPGQRFLQRHRLQSNWWWWWWCRSLFDWCYYLYLYILTGQRYWLLPFQRTAQHLPHELVGCYINPPDEGALRCFHHEQPWQFVTNSPTQQPEECHVSLPPAVVSFWVFFNSFSCHKLNVHAAPASGTQPEADGLPPGKGSWE